MLEPRLPEWDGTLINAIDDFRAQFGESTSGLAAVAISADGSPQESHTIFTDVIERRKYLEKRNRRLEIDSRGFVSSEVR